LIGVTTLLGGYGYMQMNHNNVTDLQEQRQQQYHHHGFLNMGHNVTAENTPQ
jgi:hypothetical protein